MSAECQSCRGGATIARGARRTWLCGIEKVYKRYLIAAMARNPGLLMRALLGMGTPRGLQKYVDLLAEILCTLSATLIALWRVLRPTPTHPHCDAELFPTEGTFALVGAA